MRVENQFIFIDFEGNIPHYEMVLSIGSFQSIACFLQFWKEDIEIRLSSPSEMGSFISFLNYILSPKRKQTFSIEVKQL